VFISEQITVPANTDEADPVISHVKVSPDVLHYIAVQFPPGCRGLAHVRVYANEHPVFPSDPAKDIAADSWTVESALIHQFDPGYSELKIIAWNEDDTYEHTVTVYASVLERKFLFPQETISFQIADFLRLFRRR